MHQTWLRYLSKIIQVSFVGSYSSASVGRGILPSGIKSRGDYYIQVDFSLTQIDKTDQV